MLEKGRRLGAKDFPETNWDLKRWLWMPALGFRGLFKMTFLRPRHGPLRRGRGRRVLGLRQHAAGARRRVLRRGAVGRAGRMEARAGAALPDRAAHAGR